MSEYNNESSPKTGERKSNKQKPSSRRGIGLGSARNTRTAGGSERTEKRSDRSQSRNNSEGRGDRSERGDRGERSDRGSSNYRGGGDRNERSDRGDRGGRTENRERSGRGDRNERGDRGDRGDRSERGSRNSSDGYKPRNSGGFKNQRGDARGSDSRGSRSGGFGGGRSGGGGSRGGRGGGGGRGGRGAYGSKMKALDPNLFMNDVKELTPEQTHDIKHSFNDFTFTDELRENIKKKGYVTPTPIQNQTIHFALEGKDVLGLANTVTCKTAAFCLPIINNLFKQ